DRVRRRVMLLEEEPIDVHEAETFVNVRLGLEEDRPDRRAGLARAELHDRQVLKTDRGAGLGSGGDLDHDGRSGGVVLRLEARVPGEGDVPGAAVRVP